MAKMFRIGVELAGEPREVQVEVDESSVQEEYANVTRFSRMGADFVLELVRVNPAAFHQTMEAAREAIAERREPALQVDAKLVGRIYLAPGTVAQIERNAREILAGLREGAGDEGASENPGD